MSVGYTCPRPFPEHVPRGPRASADSSRCCGGAAQRGAVFWGRVAASATVLIAADPRGNPGSATERGPAQESGEGAACFMPVHQSGGNAEAGAGFPLAILYHMERDPGTRERQRLGVASSPASPRWVPWLELAPPAAGDSGWWPGVVLAASGQCPQAPCFYLSVPAVNWCPLRPLLPLQRAGHPAHGHHAERQPGAHGERPPRHG